LRSHEESVREVARAAIERGDNICYDVAATHGQIFKNVKHTERFLELVIEWLEEHEFPPEKS
jgi:hypothetical protein